MKSGPVRLRWTQDNDIRLLQNGADFFSALCTSIDAATVSVHLETYRFNQDRTGTRVLHCLIAAAQRGVKVRVVLDGFGSVETADALCATLIKAGAQCRIFRPEPKSYAKWIPSRRRLRRLHRKVTVIDGQIAYVGGINILDDYDDQETVEDQRSAQFDFAVRVQGSLVADAAYAQERLWISLKKHLRDWRRLRFTPPQVDNPTYKGMRAALVLRDNFRFRQTFERAYLYGIAHARHDILIANAYFFPGVQFRRALIAAAARGVRVRLLLQGKAEYRVQYYATRALYDQLLRHGIEIYEYMPAYLHAKVAVIDQVATVGSSNLDPFSLLLAREANVLIDDASLAQQLQARLETAMEEGGSLIHAQAYRRQGWIRHWVNAAAYLVLRLGVALTGRAGKY